MKYRDIIGFSNKKKTSKKNIQKPESNPILENIQEEFGYVNEGPAYEYSNQVKKIERAELRKF